MKRTVLLLLACGLWIRELAAQKPLTTLTVPTEMDSTGDTVVALCCTPQDLYRDRRETCAYEWRRAASGKTSSFAVDNLCKELRSTATVVALDSRWYVAAKANPAQPLFIVDCQSNRAGLAGTSAAPATLSESRPAAAVPLLQDSKPAELPATGSDGKLRPAATAKINDRLDGVEKALREQQGAVQDLREELGDLRGANQRDFAKKLDALRKEMLDRLHTLEEAQKNSCYRIDDHYKGQDEVMIAVAGGVLRFVKVKPRTSTVAIGLSEAKANELLAEAQSQSSREIFPHILLAVPEAVREVKPFLLQDRLIDPQIYSRLTNGKDARRVAYQDVERFIAELNARCSGRAKFVLPTEEQFVAAAQWLYDPVANGLKPCEATREQDRRFDVTELLGHAWQLTRSLCVPFSDPPRAACPDGPSYIRKGGAASSTNRLECMPEYRSPSPFDIHQKETSFRLALLE